EIRRIVDAPARRIFSARPFRTDDRDHDLGALQGLLDVFAKIDAVRDRIEIHEDGAFAELRLKPIVKPAGDWAGILPAIGDRDHQLLSWSFLSDGATLRQSCGCGTPPGLPAPGDDFEKKWRRKQSSRIALSFPEFAADG